MSGVNQRDRAIDGKVDRRLRELERQMQQVPSRWAQTSGDRFVSIIGGNTYNGVDCIKYAAVAPAITSLLDPNTTTVFPDGLGRGWLRDANGHQVRRVLVWHEFDGFPSPVIGLYTVAVRDVTVLTVASGPDAGKPMTFYRFTYPF